jgi:hypothetical protein
MSRRSIVGLAAGLAVILLLVAIAAAGIALRMPVDDSTRTLSSPGGDWSLVVRSIDQGALGGSTKVLLRADEGRPSVPLYASDWLPDSAVRWLDARTVSIAGRPEMPFVAHEIATGSPATDGASLDDAGFVRNLTAPNERVALLSGLSLVLPDGVSGTLLTRPSVTRSHAWQRLLPASGAPDFPYTIVTYREPGSFTPWPRLRSGRVVASSHGGRVRVRWNRAARTVTIITMRPGMGVGVISRSGSDLSTETAARRAARQLWRELSVRGVRVP